VRKIDRSFVQGLSGDERDGSIIKAVIHMANSLKMRVVAEGIETGPQCAFLKEQLCQVGQA
jgi:EAL domain-containing protein (putative c-di-GMP-specific phosphodiesterase class I)